MLPNEMLNPQRGIQLPYASFGAVYGIGLCFDHHSESDCFYIHTKEYSVGHASFVNNMIKKKCWWGES